VEHISKNGAKFNLDKAKWFQHEYFQMLSDEEVAGMLEKAVSRQQVAGSFSHDYMVRVASMMKERITFPSELWETCCYFFEAPTEYNEKDVAKRWTSDMHIHMAKVIEILNTVPFEHDAIHKALLDDYIAANGLNTGKVMNSLRIAVVGRTVGPDMITLILTIGKEETIRRVERAIEKLKIEN
jgi:glutamyl-tRNA synthetase